MINVPALAQNIYNFMERSIAQGNPLPKAQHFEFLIRAALETPAVPPPVFGGVSATDKLHEFVRICEAVVNSSDTETSLSDHLLRIIPWYLILDATPMSVKSVGDVASRTDVEVIEMKKGEVVVLNNGLAEPRIVIRAADTLALEAAKIGHAVNELLDKALNREPTND